MMKKDRSLKQLGDEGLVGKNLSGEPSTGTISSVSERLDNSLVEVEC